MRTLRSKEDFLAAGAATQAEPSDLLTVEAASAEKALEEVSAKLGPDAQIVSANKVQRGGVGGFFAREMVQLTAKPHGSSAAPTPATKDAEVEGAGISVGDLDIAAPLRRDQATEGADVETRMDEAKARQQSLESSTMGASFEKLLARYITEEPAPQSETADEAPPSSYALEDDEISPRTFQTNAPAPVAAPTASPAVAPAPVSFASDVAIAPIAAPGTGAVGWSADELVRLQLPYSLISRVLAASPAGDLDWVEALADALLSYCPPLSTQTEIVIGPKAGQLAGTLGLQDCDAASKVARQGNGCLTMSDDSAEIGELMKVRKGRALHLVIGGAQWQGLVELEPAIVSWVGRDALVQALGLAVNRGVPLGYGKIGTRVVRANPLDIALAIREMVGRR